LGFKESYMYIEEFRKSKFTKLKRSPYGCSKVSSLEQDVFTLLTMGWDYLLFCGGQYIIW
jgi:hypothetical protein